MALYTMSRHEIRADRDRVWQAWTDPDDVRIWLELLDARLPRAVGDPLVWSFNFDLVHTARLTALIPGELCAYDWDVPGNDRPTKLTVGVRAVDAETTEIEVLHAGFDESRDSRRAFDFYDRQWWHHLERLAAYLEHRPFQELAGHAVASSRPLGTIRSTDRLMFTEMEDFHRWCNAGMPGSAGLLADVRADVAARDDVTAWGYSR
jgi:uncharacterized protein YndB with AHSA1/START domain